MPRDRRAAEQQPAQGPDSTPLATPEGQWGELTDTGSMEPSPEALAWQRRADAWAQQAEAERDQAIEPVSRWSGSASTGPPAIPPDGVSWRTETAEWRGTGGRYRQTTEWRSTTGTHGWRSTTEAWQTIGDGSPPEPAAPPPARPAISGRAWTPSGGPGVSPEANDAGPARRRPPLEGSASWQHAGPADPPSWRTSAPEIGPPSRRATIDGSATWNDAPRGDASRHDPAWRGAHGGTPWSGSGRDSAPTNGSAVRPWASADAGTAWSGPADLPDGQAAPDDGRHVLREDDRAAWRRETRPGGGPPSIGRRRAAEPEPSGDTGWAARSDTENWAGYTDTGGIQLYPDPEPRPGGHGAYGARRPEGPGRRALPAAGYGAAPTPARLDDVRGAAVTGMPAAPAQDTDGRHPDAGYPARQVAPRAYSDETAAPVARGRSRYRDGRRDDWREQSASWGAEPDTSSWTRDPDTGQWSRSEDDPRVRAWRREAARREAMNGHRHELPAGPAADAWGRDAAQTNVIPAQADEHDQYSDEYGAPGHDLPRSPRGGTTYGTPPATGIPHGTTYGSAAAAGNTYRAGDTYGATEDPYPLGRRRADPDDDAPPYPDAWRHEPDLWDSRQPRGLGLPDDESHRPRGGGGYRAGDDWRREPADLRSLPDGEPQRYGTPNFLPSGEGGPEASDMSPPLIAPLSPREPRVDAQRFSNGFSSLSGSSQRRPMSAGLPPSRRSNLLYPDDEEDDQAAGGPLAAVGYTVIWYGVPIVLFVLYTLLLNRGSQAHALETLAKAAPQFGISLVVSILVAIGLRLVSHSWKAISVGLAAAVVGGGLATVLISVITGNSLS